MNSALIRKISILIAATVMALTGTSAAIADTDVSAKSDTQEIVLTATDAPADVTNSGGITVPLEFESLINSETPKIVTVDPATGIVESVVRAPQLRTGDAGVTPGNCSGRPCWNGFYAPTASYGFVGTGTVNGYWTTRGNFYSNVREAQVCWNTLFGTPTFCSWRMAPWTIWNFTDDTAIGRSVTLY